MRAFNQITISIVLSAVMALSACAVLPIPGAGNKPPYSHEQISKIQEGYSSRDEVVSVLGIADIRRLDRYWVYHWREDSGMWFVISLPPLYGPAGPIVSKQFILFLEFDEKGNLISKKFGDKIGNKYCTVNGLCLEHKVYMAPTSRMEHSYDFDNMGSAFTISGSSKDSVPWPTLGGDRCVVVIWLNDRDWKDMQGLRLTIGNPPQPPQGPPNSLWTPAGTYMPLNLLPRWFWLPVGAYVALSLPVGKQAVCATTHELYYPTLPATFDSVENFQCEANQTMYMEIGKISKSRGRYADQVSIVLRTIDTETGRKAIAEMPRLLPP